MTKDYTAVYMYADNESFKNVQEKVKAAFPDAQMRSDGFFASVDGKELTPEQETALEAFESSTGGYWSVTAASELEK